MRTKTISLPRLNRLTPTLESTALKLMEEAGELAEAIGKLRGLSGEAFQVDEEETVAIIMSELLDVAQTAVSMMFVLEENYQVDIEEAVEKHINKLCRKGYLVKYVK
ncbi:MAG: nucleotide pyrophosphohydrolase [Syntrophomonadaceae bacterium]|jgi:NTP pyrophosphatase (non-canonical NTP hydrolase)|nr:nucleotide pyrophosphohydrolase [Syntrophomonadaceae bacterium]